ncbi:DUF4097 family beta strand repeat-containing protein [Paenisporosarcina antarctica]|uniref:DUF4097 domain-containing protein n=1 Tax=Paenisporosarcina antarctica TaxID=417367 RepID=A0A4P6ZUM4_9BACL|nr:DUF4097 family beta strand repeat-containing protein [Paenisporosarcina antarctica]QBP40072.1 hypothetical protein E2636_02395 [Paenisporosarcina antarctica]
MMLKNKWVIFLVLLLVITGGIMFTFKGNDVFGENSDKKVIEDSFTNIEILTNNTAVEIIPTKSSVATVEYSGDTSKKSKYTFDVDVKGETLSVQFKERRRFFFSFGFPSFDLKLTVSIPEKQYESIQVNSDNGRINVENIQTDVVLLETENGQIRLRNIEANTVNVETDNGKVILEHVKGEIKGNSDNGRISLITNKLDWPIDLATDNGSIEIKTESVPTNAIIDAETDNGKITIFDEEKNRATYGKGKNLIKLQTDNGRITVTK